MKREREPSPDFLTEVITRKISQYNNVENAEVEARLCLLTSKTARNERLRLPIESAAIVATPHNISVGVDRNSFEKLLATFKRGGYTMSTVEDQTIAFNDGERIEKNAEGVSVAYLKKRKLTTVDIAVPNSPYDIRIGVATETPLALDAAPTPPADAFIRRRSRTSFSIGDSLSVDFTIIQGPRPVYEVEVEMVFQKLEANAAWVAELVAEVKSLIDILKQRPAPKVPAASSAPVTVPSAPGAAPVVAPTSAVPSLAVSAANPSDSPQAVSEAPAH